MAATAAAAATRPPWTCRAPTPLVLESGASVVAAAVSLLEVRVVRELLSVVLLLSSVVDEESAVVVELLSSVVDEESSVLLESLAVREPEAVEAPDEAGSEAVPSAPATVKAGAKLKFCGFSSSVIRMVYSVPDSTASAGIVKEALSAEAWMLAVRYG